MSRWKPAGIHLTISALIGASVLALLFWVWYPAPYFRASGGRDLTLILLGVDLVLGPLLTVVVFKAGKKSLKFDLAVIAALQIVALGYGLHVVVQARPAFIVAAVDRFVLVAANEIEPAKLAEGKTPEFSTLSWTGPRVVAARLPTDTEQRNSLVFAGLAGLDVQNFPRYFVNYDEEARSLLARAKPLDALRAKGEDAATAVDAWLARHDREASGVVWMPINARASSLTMLLDAKTGTILDALPVNPW